MNKVEKIIKTLGLQAHPEGGYFKETYRSEGLIKNDSLSSHYNSARNLTTCIYFLLTSESFSAFHRIKQDEIWHFYDGSPLALHLISKSGEYSKVIVGKEINKGHVPQFIVPGGHWFAANVLHKNSFALVGCTVSPGFDFADFDLPARQTLLDLFPEHKQIITLLTNV